MTPSFLAIDERELAFLRSALPDVGRGLRDLRPSSEALLARIQNEYYSASVSSPASAAIVDSGVLEGLIYCTAAWRDYDRRRRRFRERGSGDDKCALLAAKAACEGGLFMGLSAASKPPGPLLNVISPLYRDWCRRAIKRQAAPVPAPVNTSLWLTNCVGAAGDSAWQEWLSELRGAVIISRGVLDDEYRNALRLTIDRLHSTWLKMQRGRVVLGDDIYLSHADSVITLFGQLWLAAVWLRLAATARYALLTATDSQLSTEDLNFYRGKLRTCQYVYRWQLPQVEVQMALLASLDSLCHDTDPAWL